MLVQIIDVFKIRIGVLMSLTALAGYTVTPGPELPAWQILVLVLITLTASASAGAFNQYAERDLDAKMTRTHSRPFVTGRFQHTQDWLWGIALLLLLSVAVGHWLFNIAVAAYLFLGAFFYGVVYTLWLKRRSVWNIVIGGASGSFAVLAGAAAADPSLNATSILLAVVLFLWTPPHFWSLAIALHKDYAAADVPMLPVVHGDRYAAKIILINIALLVTVSLLPFFHGLGWLYLTSAVSGGAYFLYKGTRLLQNPNPETAIQCFLASLLQLTLILVGATFDAQVF
jgi:protoheme IX farnesyltransferase